MNMTSSGLHSKWRIDRQWH